MTVLAHIGPDVSVGADVFLQHAGLLAANSTFLTNISPSAAASHIYISAHVYVMGHVQRTEDSF